ncbi:MAG: HdeD family acid-resistance protein [Proteobacteria bacterium]|nr:HdeD family acid-resistance protein [Pseudomonadota bacterium]
MMDLQNSSITNLKKNWAWYLVYGVILVIAGFILLGAPAVATILAATFFGVMLLIQGIIHIVHALFSRDKGWVWSLFLGIISVIAGIFLVTDPVAGVLGLTFLIAVLLIANGISKVVLSFQLKPHSGWGIILANGIISIILGFMIYGQWPVSGLWVIGFFLGIDTLFAGFGWISAAFAVKKASGIA